jgi:hypothetical protein
MLILQPVFPASQSPHIEARSNRLAAGRANLLNYLNEVKDLNGSNIPMACFVPHGSRIMHSPLPIGSCLS